MSRTRIDRCRFAMMRRSTIVLLSAASAGLVSNCLCGMEVGYLKARADLPSTDPVWLEPEDSGQFRELAMELRGELVDVEELDFSVGVVVRTPDPPPIRASLRVVGEDQALDVVTFEAAEQPDGHKVSLRPDLDVREGPFRLRFVIEFERLALDGKAYELELFAIASLRYRPYEASAGLTLTWVGIDD